MARTNASRVSCSRTNARWCGAALPSLVLTFALSVAETASAQEPVPGPLVVVVTNQPDAPFVLRLAAELSLFGYRVEVSARTSAEADLSELLARSGGAALIAVDQGRQTAEVVVAAVAGAGPARQEREKLDPRRRVDTNAAVLAERFRARLTELGIPPGPAPELPPPEKPVPVVLPRPSAPRDVERRLWLVAAFGATSGGLGVLPDVQLELRVFPVRWLSTSAFGKWSPVAAEVTARQAQASVRLLSGGLLIDAYPWRNELVINVGLGAMLVSADMSGRAAPPLGGEHDSVLVPAAMLQTGASLPLSPRVSTELRAFVGACAPRIGVRFADRTVAHYGQPFFGVSLGAAIGVF